MTKKNPPTTFVLNGVVVDAPDVDNAKTQFRDRLGIHPDDIVDTGKVEDGIGVLTIDTDSDIAPVDEPDTDEVIGDVTSD